ncbi:hypothetical protein [Photorhabdus caribbeanensis]|uniref:hypothetical protein n=1 Tax=Photorhabdus caribbeanensis TaxID=1004165 RepID=UPI001BD51E69|nr:hypothetical protein [Photorhabdus caribbeanensis]
MNIEQELYHAAVNLIEKRYPKGWGGAAAVRTESGKILTSIALIPKMTHYPFVWKLALI